MNRVDKLGVPKDFLKLVLSKKLVIQRRVL